MRISIIATASASALAAAGPAVAQDLVVTAERDTTPLDQPAGAASRLSLSIRETPASVESIGQAELQRRGADTARQAFEQIVGATAGNVPGNPAVVTLRGFSGNTVSVLQDGVRVSAATVVQRDTNAWHVERIDVLRGPASVLHGEGALAGVIDKVTRKPVLGRRGLDLLVSGGSFGGVYAAAGVNLPLTATAALRADASYQRADSRYDVDDNDTVSAGLTASLAWRPAETVNILLAVDHFADRYDSTYQGLPLIPAAFARDPSAAVGGSGGLVADRALRRRNTNPRGAFSAADETTARGHVDWRATPGWTVALDLAAYTADRTFLLADTQAFVPPDARFPHGSFRQSLQDFRHDHHFWNARLGASHDGRLVGLRNRLAFGVEANRTRFDSLRRQAPLGALPDVDAFDPTPIALPTGPGVYRTSDVTFLSRVRQTSLFVEDALNLTPAWLLVGGIRWDRLRLDRATVQNASGATDRNAPAFDPVSWRGGTTWQASPALAIYAQYTTAVSPVSSLLLASVANSRFRLTSGDAWEAGFKAGGTILSATSAVYRIRQKDILTRDPANPAVAVQGGRQSSRGAELTVTAQPVPAVRLTGGVSLTDARYDGLAELVGGRRLDRSGNRPVNVPATTALASVSWSCTDRVTLSAFARHAGAFYTDTANTIRVAGHTTLDASMGFALTDAVRLTVRGRNLTDAFYGEYSGYPATNVYIGAPRSFELALAARL